MRCKRLLDSCTGMRVAFAVLMFASGVAVGPGCGGETAETALPTETGTASDTGGGTPFDSGADARVSTDSGPGDGGFDDVGPRDTGTSFIFGMHTQSWDMDVERTLRESAQIGATHSVMTFMWDVIEPEPNRFEWNL
ncbi:MAG: hypothetical protein HY897_20145, partial [Deltaproteobacteria bacterium]|nr:hypothetical protein [Deltaproteobacteria bacterium]